MKKFFILALTMMAVVLACQDVEPNDSHSNEDPDHIVGDWDPMKLDRSKTLSFPSSGGVDTILVVNYSCWWISFGHEGLDGHNNYINPVLPASSGDVITYDILEGGWYHAALEKVQSNTLVVTVDRNTTGEERKAFIEMTAGDIFETLILVQEKNDQSEEPVAQAGTYVFDFTQGGYANQEEVKAFRRDGISLEFTNAKWFDNKQSLRIYSSSTVTISAEKLIEKVVFSFGEGDLDNEITADNGEFADSTWTGEAGKVVFSVGGASGHRRVQKITVSLGEKDAPADDNPGGQPGGDENPTTGEDVLTVSWTGVRSGGSYYGWADLNGSASSAVYCGNTANFQDKAIQMRAKTEESGIVSTVSAGKVRKIKVVWNDNTDTNGNGDRALDVYAHTMVYTSAEDLYQAGTAGTLVGSLKYPDDTELTIDGNYTYVGVRSNTGAVYLDEIRILWE